MRKAELTGFVSRLLNFILNPITNGMEYMLSEIILTIKHSVIVKKFILILYC